MNFKSLVYAGICGVALAGLSATETYVDLPSAKTDFWDTRSHGGVTVDTTAVAVASFASGSAVAQGLGDGQAPAWFVPFSCHRFFTPARPLDSRDPSGLTVIVR